MRFIYMFLLPLCLISCEKDITIKAGNEEQVLVVEGEIELGQYPIVVLSKSLDYFNKITPDILANSFVHNAKVEISNGTLTHRLVEYTVPINSQYSVSFYTIDPSNIATAFTGELLKNYRLNIEANGKLYSANTTIPAITRRIDSMWWENVPNTIGADTVWKRLMIRGTDRPGLGDYVRAFTKRNSEPFYPDNPSAFNDDFIDGTSYVINVERGRDRTATSTDGAFTDYFKRGDTVVLKVSQIDKATYDFWDTYEFAQRSTGNPFSTPVKIKTNITGAPALGVFAGYAPQTKTLIIPRN